jgi:uncharacterized protein
MTPDLTLIAETVVLLLAASAFAGILAGLFGIGGGAVFVPVLYQTFGLFDVDPDVSMQLAIGSSLAIVVPTSIRSVMTHRAHGAVDFDLLRRWIVVVPLGAVAGAAIAAVISSEALRGIFAVIAFALGLQLLIGKLPFMLGTELPRRFGLWIAGILIGAVAALMGIGGGVLNNTFMTLYGRTMHQAVATSAGVGVLVSIPGLLAFVVGGWGNDDLPAWSLGYISLPVILIVAPLATLFAPIGARLAHKLSKRQLQVGFGIYLLTVATRFFISLA